MDCLRTYIKYFTYNCSLCIFVNKYFIILQICHKKKKKTFKVSQVAGSAKRELHIDIPLATQDNPGMLSATDKAQINKMNTLLSFKGIAGDNANKALASGFYPNISINVPVEGETFAVETLRTTTAVYNYYYSVQMAYGESTKVKGKVWARINKQKSQGQYIYGDWVSLSGATSGLITTENIANRAITGDKIANATISSSNIRNKGITRDKIAYGTITKEELSTDIYNKEAAVEVYKIKDADKLLFEDTDGELHKISVINFLQSLKNNTNSEYYYIPEESKNIEGYGNRVGLNSYNSATIDFYITTSVINDTVINYFKEKLLEISGETLCQWFNFESERRKQTLDIASNISDLYDKDRCSLSSLQLSSNNYEKTIIRNETVTGIPVEIFVRCENRSVLQIEPHAFDDSDVELRIQRSVALDKTDYPWGAKTIKLDENL